MKSSGPRNPCPCCGRTKGSYCRWDDARIFCYQGNTCHPPTNLTRGSIHNFGDGTAYYFAGYDKGYSKNSALFCLHDPSTSYTPRPTTPQAIRRQTARNLSDLEQLREDLHDAHIATSHALAAPDYTQITTDEIRGWLDVISCALDRLVALKPRAMKLRQIDKGLIAVVQSLNEQIRELSYQKADFQTFWQDVLCDPSGGRGQKLAASMTPPPPDDDDLYPF